MYAKEKSILLRLSASALNNNLSVLTNSKTKEVKIAVAHKSSANLIHLDRNGELTSYEISNRESTANLVLQVKWCVIDNSAVLVVASQQGVQIYDSEGSILLHWHAFSNKEDTINIETFARGIVMVKGYLCVGTHNGSILAFHVPTVNSLGRELMQVLQFHPVAIACLSSWDDLLLSGDDDGVIAIWRNDGSAVKKVRDTGGYGYPCTTSALWKDLAIVGYLSGHLRVFSSKNCQLLAEVMAHARTVTAVDVAIDTGMMLSASEDTFLRVWQLGETATSCIQHKISIGVPDSQLCGANFLNDNGTEFCTVAYDSEEIACFKMPLEA